MSKYRLNMTIFGAYALFFGITTALCVPYFYAYCAQASNVTVSPESETSSKEDENREDELVHSLRVQENGSLQLRKTKTMKDANTIKKMALDTTLYKDLPSIKENSQEELNEVFDSPDTEKPSLPIHSNNSSSLRRTRPRGTMQVEALVHAPNVPNSKTFVKETSKNINVVQIDCDNVNKNLPKKKQFFKKIKTSEKLKKMWTRIRSRGQLSKSSSSEDSTQTIIPLSPVTSGSSSNQGIRSNTGTSLEDNVSTLKSHSPVGHSTLRDSKQKVVLMFHEVNGPQPIRIESSSGSNSLVISGGDSTPTGILGSESTSFRIEVQTTVDSSDQDTEINNIFGLNSLPGRLRSTGMKVKENLKRYGTL